MPSEVQILKESKARFEGVIFNQTADLGTNKSTSCKVIDEATGEVIAQSGGGGGGESDYTTATVKIRFVNAGEVTIPATQNFNIFGIPLIITGQSDNYSAGFVSFLSNAQIAVGEYKEFSFSTILYKGKCVTPLLFDSNTIIDEGAPVKVEGDVTIGENSITITGDCTISIDVSYTS